MNSTTISSSIGILGGGQLGKMLAQAGADWDLNISVLDPTLPAPASGVATQVQGSFRNYDDVLAFGTSMDILTIEIEDVNLEALKELERRGKKIYPTPTSIQLIQDKGLQKQFYHQHQLPTSDFILVENVSEITRLIGLQKIKFPFVQKLRKAGYDGKGVQIIHTPEQMDQLFDGPSVIETKVQIKQEIAVLAARNASGQVVTYDPVEMIFHPTANLLIYQQCPSDVDEMIKKEATAIAQDLIVRMEIVGLLAVELFVDENNRLLINEVAPRPHNSGHHSIEACVTSQFQQHLRCILDLPLGNTETKGYSILLNLLGEPGHFGPANYQGLDSCLAKSGVYVHLYGKKETKPFRKMGHVTVLANDLKTAQHLAHFVQSELKVIS